jgi:hypothetical protein
MEVTQAMIDAARRGELNYYRQAKGMRRFIPTPDAVIRVMLEAALAGAGEESDSPALDAPGRFRSLR